MIPVPLTGAISPTTLAAARGAQHPLVAASSAPSNMTQPMGNNLMSNPADSVYGAPTAVPQRNQAALAMGMNKMRGGMPNTQSALGMLGAGRGYGVR